MPNYRELCNRLSRIPPNISKHVYSKEITEEPSLKKMFFVSNNYPDLIPQMLCHSKIRLDSECNEKIILEMNKNIFFRNFLCVNIQQFLRIKQNEYQRYIEPNEDPVFDRSELKLVKNFGFMTNPRSMVLDDENEARYYYELFETYKTRLSFFLNFRETFDFEKHIKKPFKKLLEIVGHTSYCERRELIYVTDITECKIQNIFSCMQLHTFFEDYVTSLFDQTSIFVKNPIILINPQLRKIKTSETSRKNVLDGYIELDGSLLKKDGELIFLECKNSRNVTVEYITNFIGKVTLMEKIYGCKIKKMLFSTGFRYAIWWNLEAYPELNDIQIYDGSDFRKNYRNVVL